MDNTKYQKCTGWGISWMKTRGKTSAKMGRQLEGFLTSAENMRMEETSRGQVCLEVNYRRGQGLMPAVTPLRNKIFVSDQICSCTEILNKL